MIVKENFLDLNSAKGIFSLLKCKILQWDKWFDRRHWYQPTFNMFLPLVSNHFRSFCCLNIRKVTFIVYLCRDIFFLLLSHPSNPVTRMRASLPDHFTGTIFEIRSCFIHFICLALSPWKCLSFLFDDASDIKLRTLVYPPNSSRLENGCKSWPLQLSHIFVFTDSPRLLCHPGIKILTFTSLQKLLIFKTISKSSNEEKWMTSFQQSFLTENEYLLFVLRCRIKN